MTGFIPRRVKRVSPLIPSLVLTLKGSYFNLVWQLVPYILNVLLDMFKIFFVYISRKNNQKEIKNDPFYPASPYLLDCSKKVV